MMTRSQVVRASATACVVGASLQLGYGVLAIVDGYPRITTDRYELLWGLIQLGMVSGIAALLALDVARSRRTAVLGAAIAAAGHILRASISLLQVTGVVDEGGAADGLIVASIPLMFVGMAILGVSVLRGAGTRTWQAWTPLATVAGGLVTAAVYDVDRTLHFVLLGLLWGATWMALGLSVRAWPPERAPAASRQAALATEMTPATNEPD